MTDDVQKGNAPFDRLTGLCKQMTVPLDAEENRDVKAIVFLQDGENGGIQTHGYEGETDAIVDLFIHMKALFNAQGKDILFIPMTGPGVN